MGLTNRLPWQWTRKGEFGHLSVTYMTYLNCHIVISSRLKDVKQNVLNLKAVLQNLPIRYINIAFVPICRRLPDPTSLLMV